MVVVGYDNDLGGFIVENSWSDSWGDNGYFLLDYDVFLRDSSDAWVCTKFDNAIPEKEKWYKVLLKMLRIPFSFINNMLDKLHF